jgi:hypothetical protein
VKRLPSVLAFAGLVATACNGTSFRGATPVPRGDEPHGRVVGRWLCRDCRDATGAPAERPSRLFLIAVGSSRGEQLVLVETRRGYDSLRFDEPFEERGERVFQMVSESADGRPWLSDFRLPLAGDGPGRLAAADRWREVDRAGGGFRAHVERVRLSCRLQPVTRQALDKASEL